MTSTSYPKDSSDWKGVFIRHLVFALSRETEVGLRLWAPPGEIPQSVSYACTEIESAWLIDLTERGGIAHLLRTKRFTALPDAARLLWYLARAYHRHADVDLVHANWLQSSIPLLFRPKPALVTVLGSDLGLLRWPGVTSLLRRVFQRCRTCLAPNGEWMVPELRSKFGHLAEVRFIPFGIDDGWFSLERTIEGKPEKWLVVSRLTEAKIGPLLDWGRTLFEEGHRELHLFGPMQEAMDLPAWVHYHGPTHPQPLRERWFPRATGLITLSRHDEGRPQVILEAMAAGLPVLASDLPAHRSIIAHRETGWITSDRDGLAEGLKWLAEPGINRTVGQRAKAYVRENTGTWDDCVHRYLSAYRSLLNR